MSPRPKRNYLDNNVFLEELIKCKEEGEVSDELGEMFIKICTNLGKSPNFINYSYDWKEDMISESLILCMKYWQRFDPERGSNPFAYFTMVAFNAYRAYLKKKKIYLEHTLSLEDHYNSINEQYHESIKKELKVEDEEN